MLRVWAIWLRLVAFVYIGDSENRPARLAKANRAADAIGKRLAKRLSERVAR